MSRKAAWSVIEAEAKDAFRGEGRFPFRAYSEFMPPPYVGVKPYAPALADLACTSRTSDPTALDVDEYEQHQELDAGLARIADHVVKELDCLLRGDDHAFPRTFLDGNPAWPAELADAAATGALADDPIVLLLPLALSRTQDDLGNVRWTLFGASHHGPAAALWRSWAGDDGAERLAETIAWAGLDPHGVRVWADRDDVPAALHPLLAHDADHAAAARTLVTFTPFAQLPAPVRAAYLARRLHLVPSPASLIFFEHPRYRRLAAQLPHAMQIPLLLLFPRVEGSCTIRVPQSGWLDEHDPSQAKDAHGRRIVSTVRRTHRWERVARDAARHGDGKYTDSVTTALFSTAPDDVGLYGKPMARNAQIWTDDYTLLLDGPNASAAELERAARATDAGGRFGYRFQWPAMRAGARELWWHRPLVARRAADPSKAERMTAGAPLGYVSAERDGADPLELAPRLLAREIHVACATQLGHEPGHKRFTSTHNARKILEARELLGAPIAPSFARALVRVAKDTALHDWLDALPSYAHDPHAGARIADALRAAVGHDADPGHAITLDHAGTRGFEEEIWKTIAFLAEGRYRQKSNGDGIAVNHGKHGGPAAKAAHLHVAERRDLEALGDHLHERYRALIARHGMEGKAEVVDHVFRWETDFAFPWMDGWKKNQDGPHERNVVCVIPGRNRGEAVVMGDHYDTAYMEDVYDDDRGGDLLRAPAAGADDNHSATTALLMAADALLPLAAKGELERDVWLVHLTGEEFPADCMGARALVQHLVEDRLRFTREDGSAVAMHARVTGAFILDMVGHNTERDRDVFQIAPGEGAASLGHALRAHRANLRWNRAVHGWNRAVHRRDLGRARRMPDGSAPPPPFAHLAVAGEVRVEWEPRSALFNTDGQVFSDAGVPVVLFMENYDINRTGYHDTHDTMANIDLDYCAAVTAIAIETVADAARER